MLLLKSENMLHAIQARRLSQQPFRRPQGASRKGHAIGGAMRDLDALPGGRKDHRVYAQDIAAVQAGKSDADGLARLGQPRTVVA